jgi:glycosyltransferase involved in cell wall biosynthesis
MNPEISVIIPALNEEKYIGHAIKGLTSQTFKNFETIVVDGGSRDNTVKIAKKHARVIIQKKPGAAVARNSGAEVARGRLLLFLDADTWPSPYLLEIYRKVFADKKVVAATGPVLPLEKAKATISAGYFFVSMIFVKASILLSRPCIVGSNFAVRKDAFAKVKGFNPKMITYEDWDLSLRLKKIGRIKFVDNAEVKTSVRRINAWGVSGFFAFYVNNMARYTFFKKPRKEYRQIR